MSVSKPIVEQQGYDRYPGMPDFWDELVEYQVKCYICETTEHITYVRHLALNFCSDECSYKYMAIPKPSILVTQCFHDEEKVPKDIIKDAYEIATFCQTAIQGNKFPVLYYTGNHLDGMKIFGNLSGTFPQAFYRDDDKGEYKYAWTYREPSNTEAKWMPIPLDDDYTLYLIGTEAKLYDMYDVRSERPAYTFSALILNKIKV